MLNNSNKEKTTARQWHLHLQLQFDNCYILI